MRDEQSLSSRFSFQREEVLDNVLTTSVDAFVGFRYFPAVPSGSIFFLLQRGRSRILRFFLLGNPVVVPGT